MVTALMGIYFFVVWLIFKKLGVAWTKNRTIGVVVAGFFVLIILMLGWKISAPTVTDGAVTTSPVIQMRTDVSGRIVKVWVTQPRDVKKGEPLFQVDPARYRFKMELADAQLKQAREDVKALGASYDAAVALVQQAGRRVTTQQAAVRVAAASVASTRDQIVEARSEYAKAKADVDKAESTSEAARVTVEMVEEAYKSNATSKYQLTEAQKNADAAAAAVVAAHAGAEKSRVRLEQTIPSQLTGAQAQQQQAQSGVGEAESALAAAMAQAREVKAKLDSTIDGEHTVIRQARENYELAKWDFEHTTTYAPVDGEVVSTVIRTGTMMRAFDYAMTVISTEESWIVAAVPQYLSDFVEEGNPVDITFTMYPGQIFQGIVKRRLWANQKAQALPSGELPDITQVSESGPYAVRIELTGVPAEFPIRFGAVGTASIYTEYWTPFKAIQKMVINMSSWMNYLG